MRVPTPSESLHRLERALRELVRIAIQLPNGTEWQKIEAKHGDEWRQRLQASNARRLSQGGQLTDEHRLLDFTELYELNDLVNRHWEPLSQALGDKKRTMALLQEVESYRNDIAHSRPILPHQRLLMAGLAGHIENKVVLYVSSSDPTGGYYPVITSVRDQLGTDFAGLPSDLRIVFHYSELTLSPGDELTIEVDAVDPQSRQMEIAASWSNTNERGIFVTLHSGAPVTLVVPVTDATVADDAFLQIRITALGTPYHRGGDHDQVAAISYRVVPPR
ncbi:hypothetical protein [Microbacterium sp. KR10-403]|uniref:hypothetical protein n=1 Tax=Microbacterium sp. KR10-403 TaxID=3158581 RepID=UPI0032E50E46